MKLYVDELPANTTECLFSEPYNIRLGDAKICGCACKLANGLNCSKEICPLVPISDIVEKIRKKEN